MAEKNVGSVEKVVGCEGGTSRRRRLHIAFLNQPWTILELHLPSFIAYSQRNITVPRSVRSCCRIRLHLFLFFIFSLSKKKCLAVRHRTACQFPTHYALIVFKYGQMWFMHIKQVYFLFSKQEENISSRSSRDQNKLCTHDKNWKHADLWVKNNLLCFNVCISFGTCKFNVWIDVDLLQFYPTSPVTTTTTTTTTIIIIIIIFFNII